MEEWRVTYQVGLGVFGGKITSWSTQESGPYGLKRNAWREFQKRIDMPEAYRNVKLEKRIVTFGTWQVQHQ
jgi:plasmid replication initiation protein